MPRDCSFMIARLLFAPRFLSNIFLLHMYFVYVVIIQSLRSILCCQHPLQKEERSNTRGAGPEAKLWVYEFIKFIIHSCFENLWNLTLSVEQASKFLTVLRIIKRLTSFFLMATYIFIAYLYFI